MNSQNPGGQTQISNQDANQILERVIQMVHNTGVGHEDAATIYARAFMFSALDANAGNPEAAARFIRQYWERALPLMIEKVRSLGAAN